MIDGFMNVKPLLLDSVLSIVSSRGERIALLVCASGDNLT